jgi:multisubunit Na+/H+ antiporter MnhF subunit
MTVWMLATIGLVPPASAALLSAGHGQAGQRLVALQLGTALVAMMLALMTFTFDQPSFVDLALVLSLLSLPGTLLVAMFLERWL